MNTLDWVNNKFRLLIEAKYFFYFILIIGIIPIISSINISKDFPSIELIKVYGLIILIVGTWALISSLNNKLKIYKSISLPNFISEHIKKLFGFGKGQTIEIGIVEERDRALPVDVDKSYPSPKEDLNEIIKYFDKNISFLYEKMKRHSSVINDEIEFSIRQLNESENIVRSEIESINMMVINAEISEIWFDLYSFALIITGIILTSIPELIVLIF